VVLTRGELIDACGAPKDSFRTVPAPLLPPGCRVIRKDAQGNILMVVLPVDTEIDGVPCLAGPVVHLHANGRLAQCDLARDALVQGVRFATGSILQLDDEGRLEVAWPVGPVTLAGREYPDGCALDFAPDGSVAAWTYEGERRDAAGHLLSALLRAERVIDGIRCAAAHVGFYRSGRLETATLACHTTVGSLALPGGTTIGLSEDGRLDSVRAPVALTLAGIDYPAGAFLRLDASGHIVGYATIEVEAVACRIPSR
jgi:hypothetical protein